MDEHRVGLRPILRRVWAARGQRPVAIVRPRYEWTYVYAFVRPATGEAYWRYCQVKISCPGVRY
jgi:hypothetical protein